MRRSDLKPSHQRVPRLILNKIECFYCIPLQYLAYVVLLSRTASPSPAVIAVTVKIRVGRMTVIGPRGWGRSGLETFLGTMDHRFRFSTSGNPTKHMPIGYLSLWVQPRSVTSGDLSWPWPSSGAMSRVTYSHVFTPISSTIPIQVNRTTPSCGYSRFRWNLAKVVPLMTS